MPEPQARNKIKNMKLLAEPKVKSRTVTPKSRSTDCEANCVRCDTPEPSRVPPEPRNNRMDVMDAVLSYEYSPLVWRLWNKEGFTQEEADDVFQDMLKFLYLCGTRKETFAPTEPIDRAWHAFILFTREYASFCNKMFGEFVHHSPRESNPQPPGQAGGKMSVVRNTLIAAKETFGVLSDNWKYPGMTDVACNRHPCVSCDTPSTSCEDK